MFFCTEFQKVTLREAMELGGSEAGSACHQQVKEPA